MRKSAITYGGRQQERGVEAPVQTRLAALILATRQDAIARTGIIQGGPLGVWA
jgi:hypothetical protein